MLNWTGVERIAGLMNTNKNHVHRTQDPFGHSKFLFIILKK